jgi:hypothetical protein
MPAVPLATVVVTARDRWTQAPATLDHLLARTDRRHPVVVVDARAPRRVGAALDRFASSGRIRVTRRRRHLAANEARNLGADGARTEWVAFVENDTLLSDRWLDTLLAAGEARGAASTYPVYLEPGPTGPVVHGLGADLEVVGADGARWVRETQHHLGQRWPKVAAEVESTERLQSEFHAVVVRRDLLERMGGLDEGLLSWFDHTDLALHHQRLDTAALFVPEVACLYMRPPPVPLLDVPSFLLRWSDDWYQRSLHHLCSVWGFDDENAGWDSHERFRTSIRRRVAKRWPRMSTAINRAVVDLERLAQSGDARQGQAS